MKVKDILKNITEFAYISLVVFLLPEKESTAMIERHFPLFSDFIKKAKEAIPLALDNIAEGTIEIPKRAPKPSEILKLSKELRIIFSDSFEFKNPFEWMAFSWMLLFWGQLLDNRKKRADRHERILHLDAHGLAIYFAMSSGVSEYDEVFKKILTESEIELLSRSFKEYREGRSFQDIVNDNLGDQHRGVREMFRRLLDIDTVISAKNSLPSKEEATREIEEKVDLEELTPEISREILEENIQRIVSKLRIPGIPLENEVASLIHSSFIKKSAAAAPSGLLVRNHKNSPVKDMTEVGNRQNRLKGTSKKRGKKALTNGANQGMNLRARGILENSYSKKSWVFSTLKSIFRGSFWRGHSP